MIELNDVQIAALAGPNEPPTRVVNPHTHETFVLLSVAEYQRLTTTDYDDSPWTRDELEALAMNAGRAINWDATGDDYDRAEEPS